MLVALALAVALSGAAGRRARRAPRRSEAERLAQQAVALAAQDPAAALAKARRALALTAEFIPTEYVDAGRKGEVVEDEFKAARDAYKRHRATLYEAVGSVLARQAQPLAASRYQRRAFDSRPDARPRPRPRALAQRSRPRARGARHGAARDRRSHGPAARGGGGDRARGRRRRAAERAGRDRPRTARGDPGLGRSSCGRGRSSCLRASRLSTNPVFRLDEAEINVIYAAEASCRSCSADLEELARQVPKRRARAHAAPGRRPGQRAAPGAGALPPAVAAAARAQPRDEPGAASALAADRRARRVDAGGAHARPSAPRSARRSRRSSASDVQETVPRANWNRRPVDRTPPPKPPACCRRASPRARTSRCRPSSRPRSRPSAPGAPRRR